MGHGIILESAFDIIATGGLQSLSIRRVASLAGLSPGSVQYYYPKKLDMIRAGQIYINQTSYSRLKAALEFSVLQCATALLPLDKERDRQARVRLAYAAACPTEPHLTLAAAEHHDAMCKLLIDRGLSHVESLQILALIDGVSIRCLAVPSIQRRGLADSIFIPFVQKLTIRDIAEDYGFDRN